MISAFDETLAGALWPDGAPRREVRCRHCDAINRIAARVRGPLPVRRKANPKNSSARPA